MIKHSQASKKFAIVVCVLLVLPMLAQACGGYGVGASYLGFGYANYAPALIQQQYYAPPVVQSQVYSYSAPAYAPSYAPACAPAAPVYSYQAYAAPASYASAYAAPLYSPFQAFTPISYYGGGYNIGRNFIGRSYGVGANFHNVGSNVFARSNAFVYGRGVGHGVFNTGGIPARGVTFSATFRR